MPDGKGKGTYVLEHPGLLGEAELGELVGYIVYGLQWDELEAVGQLFVAGEVEIFDKVLDVTGIQEGVGRKRGRVIGHRDAPAHDAGEDVFDGFREDVQGQLLFLNLLYFLSVVVLFKALQRFLRGVGETLEGFYEGVCHGLIGLVEEVGHFANHVIIYVAIAGEGSGTFAVTGKLAYEVGVFDFLIEVADEGAAGHMGTGDVADGVLLGLFGAGVHYRDDAVDSCSGEPFTDGDVEFPNAHAGEEVLRVFAFVAVHDFHCGGSQVDFDYALALFLCLFGDVLDGEAVAALDDVGRGEGEKVADAAAYVALEYEDVAGKEQVFIGPQVGFVIAVAFVGGEIDGGAVVLAGDGEFLEGVVGGVAHVHAPVPVGADGLHVVDDGVLGASERGAAVLGVRPGVFVAGHRLEGPVVDLAGDGEKGVLVEHEVPDGGEVFRRHGVQQEAVAGVHLVAVDDLEDDAVVALAGAGEFCVFEVVGGFALESEGDVFVHLVFLREEVAVHGVLQPVLGEVFNRDFVAGVNDVGGDEVQLGLGIHCLLDFGRDDAGFDDDLSFLEVFGKDEGAGVGAEGDGAGVAVPEKDFRLAGIFVRLGRKSEGN